MATIPNVCLAKETSSPRVYFVCGGTKMGIPNPAEFAAVGFRWDKVRTVPDGTLAGFVDKPFLPPAATKASDVFLAPLKECRNWSIRFWPPEYGRWFPNRQPLESLMAQNVIVVGWLVTKPDESFPYVNLYTWGCEDVHYNIKLDPDFVERMYGLSGLSTLLNGQTYRGNLIGEGDAAIVEMPRLPTEDRSEVDGKSKGVTFNSFILPGNGNDIHGELNAWHEFNTTGDSGERPIWWPHHFVGRGPAPQGWKQVTVDKDSPWFPWDIYAPSGDRLHPGDYVMMRGPIWQDALHGDGATPEQNEWHAGPTLGHEGWVEMHPIDWIVRLQPRPTGVRKTVGRVASATFAGQDGPPRETLTTITPDFLPSSPTSVLSVRDVQEIVDGRCSDMATVIPHSRWGEFGGSRWKSFDPSFGPGAWAPGHVEALVNIQGTAARQGRFKASYIVSWRQTEGLDQVWFDDALPASAHPQGNELWAWVAKNPKPFSGTKAHASVSMPGMHQHFFDNATPQPLVVYRGYLFAMVYLDPDDAPSEIMLQWNDGSWDHRAYWGDNLIDWGVDGTPSRIRMGPLPESGEWMRLEVPASAVNLEGRTIGGMAFTLWGGRAAWDYAGVSAPSPFQ